MCIEDKLLFCNLNVNIRNKDELFELPRGRIKIINTLNAHKIHMANENLELFNFINANYTTIDGEIPLKLSRIRDRRFRNVQKLSGSDIVYDFYELAQKKKYRFFFLGGTKDSNEKAVRKVRQKYEIEIEGFSPEYESYYPFSDAFVSNCMKRIEIFRPDIVFVGFGVPKQEFFIRDNKDTLYEYGVKYICASGGTVDFVSGIRRAVPKSIAKMGLSSIYRLFDDLSLARLKRIIYSFGFMKYIKEKPAFGKKDMI